MSGFTHAHRVRFIECDPQGRANNAFYLAWIDDAFHAWLVHAGDFYNHFERAGLMYVMAHVEVDYLRPARFDQLLNVAVAPRPPGRTSLVVDFRVTSREAREDLSFATARYVCVDAAHEAPASWPEPVAAAVRRDDGG